MVLCVDNASVAAPKQEDIKTFVEEPRNKGFDFEIKENFTKCLGIGIEELDDGTRHMTQKGLIKKTIENAKRTGSNPDKTPTTQIPLGSDADREDCNNVEWHCASIVEMSLCVSNNT